MDAAEFRQDESPLALPASAGPVAPPGFPLVATIAPLAAAGLIWAVTQSPFALVFAGLSPIIALASVADGRRQSRRARRVAARDHAAAIERLTTRVRERQAIELLDRRTRAPSATYGMSDAGRAGRWTGDAARFATVTLGSGVARSSVRVGGEPADDEERALLQRFRQLSDAPIEADATLGIGLIGSATLTRSIARGLLLQLAHAYPPGMVSVGSVPEVGWDWARELPHWNADESGHDTVRVVEATAPIQSAHAAGDRSALIVLAETVDDLTLPCRVIVRVNGPTSAQLIAAPDRLIGGTSAPDFIPEMVSGQQALLYAGLLAQHARASGLARVSATLPNTIGFAELEHTSAPDSTTSLSARLGVDSDGPLTIDLVCDGPHAVVAGTTGSGKSELLTTWVAALAAAYSPDAVGFLLVDFKGGSAFAPLMRLPHCLGVITDLGPAEAERALRSLKAELRRRERMLADWGARSVAESGGRLGRLVIVVDEFAAMLDGFPELHALFVDIAARGRSLGVHTILCTQRPAGVVRDALLANCALRISLRVHDSLDSVAVVGTDAASRLPSSRPGRCVVARDGVLATAQIAVTSDDDVESIVHSHSAGSAASPQRRPWLDPLPAVIALESLQAIEGGAIVGVEDAPDEQRQSVVTLRPDDGHLLISGVHGSGKTTALQTIAAQCGGGAVAVSGTEQLWDVLQCALSDAADRRPRLLLIDDLDALIARMPGEYQDAAVDTLARVLRDGPGSALSVVASVQRMTPLLRSCGSLFGSTLLLEQNDKHDYALAGGPVELYDARHRPGHGVWRGHHVQIARATRPPSPASPITADTAAEVDLVTHRTILVTRMPAVRARELRRSGAVRTVVEIDSATTLGSLPPASQPNDALEISGGDTDGASIVLAADPATWQRAWSLFSAVRPGSTVVFDGCTLADVRGLLNTRELPPLIDGPDRVWLLRSDGRFDRGRLTTLPGSGAPERVREAVG